MFNTERYRPQACRLVTFVVLHRLKRRSIAVELRNYPPVAPAVHTTHRRANRASKCVIRILRPLLYQLLTG